MRFMMLMIPKGYEKAEPGKMPDAKAVAAMMKYNESLQKAGVLLALDGLHPPSMGARISFPGGKPTVRQPGDGSFPFCVGARRAAHQARPKVDQSGTGGDQQDECRDRESWQSIGRTERSRLRSFLVDHR